MPEVGLIITGEDKATAMLESIGRAGKSSLEGIRGAAGKATDAFAMLGKATVIFNQAMELGKKALETFRIVIGDTIRTALDFRKLGDPAIEAFKHMERQALILRARLGDILIPLAQGLHDAFVGVGNGVVEWINANRKLIATNIATWMADVARITIDGVAWGALQVTKAYKGWLVVIGTVQKAVNVFFSLWVNFIADTAGALGSLIGLVDKGLGGALDNVAESAALLAAEFDEAGETALAGYGDQVIAIEELERKLIEYKDIAIDFVGEAELAMHKRIKASRIGGIKTIEEQTDAIEELGEAADAAGRIQVSASNIAGAALARVKEQYALLGKELDVEQKRMVELGSTIEANALFIGDQFAKVVTGSQSMAQAVANSTISVVKQGIMAAAASAAAKQLDAHAFIPFVGILIGSAAAAAMFGVVQSYMGKFDTGGIFRSASGSGVATLHDKERVLSQQQTQSFDRLVEWLTASRPAMAGAGTGAPQVNNFDFRSMIPRRGVELQRAVLEIDKTQKKLKRRGRVR